MGYEKTLTQGYPSVKQERASFSASGVLVCSGTVVGATENEEALSLSAFLFLFQGGSFQRG